MDVAEVINPQFAFPVFGVVLCAVLVFAFGFRSSVQPPSFIFEDEKKQKKSAKKPKQKLQNGHIGNDLTNGPSSTGSSPKQPKHSSANKQPTEKNGSIRSRKKPATPKAPAKVEKEKKEEPIKEQDAGDWIPALSRKEKKMRGKKDERFGDDGQSDEAQPDSTSASPKARENVVESTPEVGPGGDNAETKKPMDQRTARKERKKKSADSKTAETASVGKPVVTATSATAVTPPTAAKVEKGEKRSDEASAAPTKKQEKPQTGEVAEISKVENKTESSPEKKSPKKKKKRSTRLPEQVEVEVQPGGVEEGLPVEPTDVVGETTVPDAAAAIAEAMRESPDIESQNTDSVQQSEPAVESPQEPKPDRSPKKKKKSRDKEKSQVASDSHVEASQTQSLAESSVLSAESRITSSAPVSQTQPQTQEAAVDRLNVSSTAETLAAEAASTKPSTSSEDQPKVTFDELGDWKEAKPVKKKKKARREN